MTRRARFALIAAGVLAVLLLAAVLVIRALLSPQRFTGVLQQAVSDVGLVLKLQGPAKPDLFPSPAVEMRGVRLSLPGEPTLLSADRLRLVVPWSSLLGGAPAITRLEVAAPRVDLAQVRGWIQQLPPTQGDGPPSLPDIDAGMRIRGGRLVSGDELLLANVAIDAGSLHMGQSFSLDVKAETADAEPVQLQLSALPVQSEDSLHLEDLNLTAASDEAKRLSLTGELAWYGGNRLRGELDGRLELADANYQVSLALVPQAATDLLSLDVRVDSEGTHMALHMSPREVAQWWQAIRDSAAAQLPLPPIAGTVKMQQLDVGALHIEGLQVESTHPVAPVSVAPTAAESTLAPATARGTDNTPATAASATKGPA